MKFYKILYLSGLLLLAAACAEDDLQERAGGQKVPVSLSYRALQADDTRASASQSLNEDVIASGKEVMVRISNYNADTWTNYIYATADGGVLTQPATNPPYYPLDGTHIDIRAFYPAAAYSGTHTVAADQTVDDNYINSDLMVAANVNNQERTSSAVPLAFAHKMAKLAINVSPGTAVKQINSVTLKNVQRTVTFNVADGTLSDLSGSQDDIAIVTAEATDDVTVRGAAVIPPQTINGALLQVGVTMDNDATGTATYTVDHKAFAENCVYTLNITINGPEVNTSTAITDWTANGSVTIDPMKSTSPNTFYVNGVTFQMVPVKGGTYETLNQSAKTGTLSDFMIGETEVTRGLWKAVMGGGVYPDGSSAAQTSPVGWDETKDQYPVQYVSWNDITQASTGFLARLNALTENQRPAGFEFQLPTFAQWEWAARGGVRKENYTYAGSNTISDVAWWGSTSPAQTGANANNTTHPVAQLQPNSLGLYDMSGNLWEWVQDRDNIASQGCIDFVDIDINEISSRACRGGCVFGPAGHSVVFSVGGTERTDRANWIGFRLVLAPKRLTFKVGDVYFNMTLVKGGAYSTMGGVTLTTPGTLTDYYIGQLEVTNGLWNAVMGSKPAVWSSAGANDGQPNNGDNYPVAYVSWNDICNASGFLDQLNTQTASQRPAGMTFKLPSEAQWEYAARGGQLSKGYTYSGSNYIENVGWWGNNGSTLSYTNPVGATVNGNSGRKTNPVGTKAHNELGLYDMTGNAWEWCQDWSQSVVTSPGTDFVQTTEGSNRVYRGGGWGSTAARCAVSDRGNNTPDFRNAFIGLRLVLQ